MGPIPANEQSKEEWLPELPLRERDKDVDSDEREAFMTMAQAELLKLKQEFVDQGIEKGIEKGISQSILAILSARGIAARDEVRARVLSCTDRARLERWLARAATAPTADDAISDQ